MAREIELKAWVNNPEEVKTKLSNLTVFKGCFEKNDFFYGSLAAAGNQDYGIRLRNESFTSSDGTTKEANLVTCKIKQVQNGIEVNKENEFEVSPVAAFKDFLLYLGYQERNIKKRKKGSSYDNKGMTIELTEVEGLGWFIEIEILIEEKDDDKIESAKERLLAFLDKLEIPRAAIESRSYSAMLMEPDQFKK